MRNIPLIILLSFCLLGASKCGHYMPAMDVNFWAADSHQEGIVDKQHNDFISCRDEVRFEQYVCLTREDVSEIYHTLQQCKQWRKGTEFMEIDKLRELQNQISIDK